MAALPHNDRVGVERDEPSAESLGQTCEPGDRLDEGRHVRGGTATVSAKHAQGTDFAEQRDDLLPAHGERSARRVREQLGLNASRPDHEERSEGRVSRHPDQDLHARHHALHEEPFHTGAARALE